MTTELAEITEQPDGLTVIDGQHVTNPTEERNRAVAELLAPAYANATNVKLTKAEREALMAPFDDRDYSRGAGGKNELIYLGHAHLRNRLHTVLGIGAVMPVRRREWSEEFTTNKNERAVRVYVDVVLVIRGCAVGDAIGSAVYYPNNASSDFSDAMESAKSNAFLRCCKEFGVGLDPWKPGWSDAWKVREKAGLKPKAAAPYPDEEAQIKLAKSIELFIGSKLTRENADQCKQQIVDRGSEVGLSAAEVARLQRMVDAQLAKPQPAKTTFEELKALINASDTMEKVDFAKNEIGDAADAQKITGMECENLSAMLNAQVIVIMKGMETAAAAT
jgi:hypothetical protein